MLKVSGYFFYAFSAWVSPAKFLSYRGEDVSNQVIPQMTPQNLRKIKPMNLAAAVDGKPDKVGV